jgi:hypothetical protein
VHRLIAQRLVFDCQRSSATIKRRESTEPHSAVRAQKIYRAPLEAEPSLDSGGDSGARTRSLRLAKPALSQLSYIPVRRVRWKAARSVVGLGGLEPPTSRLSGVRSNQLSYRPTPRSVAEDDVEPAEADSPPRPSRAKGRRRPERGPGSCRGQLGARTQSRSGAKIPAPSSRREKNSARGKAAEDRRPGICRHGPKA